MFSVGDKVIHRAHGAGIISMKKEMQITETPHCYLVIQMLGSDSTLMVPQERAEQRLRPACKRTTLQRLLTNELASEPQQLPPDYKKRQQYIEEKLKSGETKEWIEVVRDLTYQDEQKSLSQGDQQLLDRAMDLLSGEIALAQGVEQGETKTHLESVIQHQRKLADQRSESSNWRQMVGRKVMESFTKSSADSEIGAD